MPSTNSNFDSASENTGSESGSWDSIHVFEVESTSRKSAVYKITSTVILDLNSKVQSLGSLDLSGNLTRQTEQSLPVEDSGSHIANIGSMIEDIESKLRNVLNEVYFGKTRDIIGDLRTVTAISETATQTRLQTEVTKGLGA